MFLYQSIIFPLNKTANQNMYHDFPETQQLNVGDHANNTLPRTSFITIT